MPSRFKNTMPGWNPGGSSGINLPYLYDANGNFKAGYAIPNTARSPYYNIPNPQQSRLPALHAQLTNAGSMVPYTGSVGSNVALTPTAKPGGVIPTTPGKLPTTYSNGGALVPYNRGGALTPTAKSSTFNRTTGPTVDFDMAGHTVDFDDFVGATAEFADDIFTPIKNTSGKRFNPNASKIADSADDIAKTVASGADDVIEGATKGKWFKSGGFFDDASGKLKGFYDKATAPELDYTKGSGLQAYGKNIGKAINWANALYQGYNAAQGLGDIGEANELSDDLMADIISSSYNSPTIQYDLSPEQLDILREVRSGNYDNSADLSDIDLLGVLGDTGMGVLTGIGGGVPGMIIGGIGGLANSVIGDLGSAKDRSNAELEALYSAVLASEQQHNALKRQRAYAML